MARTNADHTQKVYLSIVGGRFAERVKSDTPGAVKRYSEKKHEDVWEILNDRTFGLIRGMKIESGDYGKQLLISMNDVDENYIITIPVESKYFDSFCSKIGNADLGQKIELAPYSFSPKEEEGKRIGMNLYQNSEKLGYFFSKEDSKGKPFPENENLSKEDWKIYKIQERKFYCEYINNFIISGSIEDAADLAAESMAPDDDLPF